MTALFRTKNIVFFDKIFLVLQNFFKYWYGDRFSDGSCTYP